MIRTVVGSFETLANAHRVVEALRAAGFMASDINVVASESAIPDIDGTKAIENGDNGATAGAVAGGALGGAAGLMLGLMGLAIPGIGPVLAAGPITAALIGAGAGGVAGGLLGGLTDLGISQGDAESYAEMIRRGGGVIVLRVDDSRVDAAEDIMHRNGAIDMRNRVVLWQDSGWRGYDPDAPPLSKEQVRADRKRAAEERAREAAETELRR